MTGGIACGKSLLSRYLNELGVATLDADDIVHDLIPDPAERRRLAAEVFFDPAKRKALEARLHPQVLARFAAWFDGTDGSDGTTGTDGTKIAIIPLLFEVRWDKYFDIICTVASSREKQIERMTATRGYSREEAEARLAAQLPVVVKAEKSHYVIANDGTAADLRNEAERFVNWLKEKEHG